jgi:hypothetical protein
MVALGHVNSVETLKQRITEAIQTIRPGTLELSSPRYNILHLSACHIARCERVEHFNADFKCLSLFLCFFSGEEPRSRSYGSTAA